MNLKRVFVYFAFISVFLSLANAKDKMSVQAKWKNDEFSVKITENTFEYKNLSTNNTITFNCALTDNYIELLSVKEKKLQNDSELNNVIYKCYTNNFEHKLFYSITTEKFDEKDKRKIVFSIPYYSENYKTELYEDTSLKDGLVFGLKVVGASAAVIGTAVITDKLTFSDAEFNSLNKKIEKELIGN